MYAFLNGKSPVKQQVANSIKSTRSTACHFFAEKDGPVLLQGKDVQDLVLGSEHDDSVISIRTLMTEANNHNDFEVNLSIDSADFVHERLQSVSSARG